jgi:hypothetical protein
LDSESWPRELSLPGIVEHLSPQLKNFPTPKQDEWQELPGPITNQGSLCGSRHDEVSPHSCQAGFSTQARWAHTCTLQFHFWYQAAHHKATNKPSLTWFVCPRLASRDHLAVTNFYNVPTWQNSDLKAADTQRWKLPHSVFRQPPVPRGPRRKVSNTREKIISVKVEMSG